MAKNKYITKLGAVNITPNTVKNTPDVLQVDGKNWVYFGKDNLLPYYLADSVQHSPTHGAIIDFKATVINGNGLDYDNLDTGLIDKNELTESVEKASTDIPIFEAFTWLLITNVNGDIIKVRPLPNEGIRVSDLDPATGKPSKYFFSYKSKTKSY